MARRVGGWASLIALAAIGCRAGAPAETTRGAATASVQIGAETSVDQPAYKDRQGTQVGGWAIPGGPGALIVWEDSGDYSSISGGAEQSIYGARVDTQGALLDRVGFSITPTRQDNGAYPMGAFSVDRWLVIWYDSSSEQVRGARVGTDGTLLDPNGIDISLTTNSGYPMAVVPDANGFIVMWSSNVLANDPFYMAKVGLDGSVTPAGGGAVTLPSETPALYVAAAAPVGNQIALLMVSNRITSPVPKALLVDHTGAAVSALSAAGGPPYASTAGVSTGFANAAASNGSETFMLWQQYATIGNLTPPVTTTLVARRLGADGQWIDSAPIQVRAAGANVGRVGVLWDGTNFICYWADHGGGPYFAQLTYRRYAPDGTPVDPAPVAISNLASAPYGDVQLTLVGGQVFATLVRTTTTNEGGQSDGILLRVLDATLKPLGSDATIISAASNAQYLPRAAGAPGGAFVAWVDDRLRSTPTINGSSDEDIYGALVTPGAAGLAETVTPISTSPNIDGDPAVGWDGTRFTIVFRNGPGYAASGRYLVHVDATGTRTGAMVGPLETTDSSAQSLLTWNGSEYLMAWFDGANSALGAPYEGRRLSSADALLDATHFTVQPSVSPFAAVQADLGGVALGGTFLLASQGRNDVGGDSDVFGLAVGANGTPATTTGVTLANGAGDQDGPAMATDGTSALVLWRDNGTAPGPRILARHVDATLAPLDSDDAVVASATPPGALGPPALAWTGSSYVAVWTTVTGGLISFTGCTLGADRHCVAGTETSVPTGISAGPSAATVIELGGVGWPGGIQDVSLVWTNTGGVLFYRRFDDDPLVRRLRLYARSVNGTGAPPTDGGVTPDASSTGGRGGSSAGGTGGGGASGSAGRGGTGGAAGAVAGAGRDGGAAGGPGTGGSAGVSGASGGGAGTGGVTGTGGGATGAAGATGSAGTAGSGATDAGSGAAGGAGGNRDGSAGSGSAGAQGSGGATAGATGAASSGCSCELSTSNRSTPSFLALLLALGSRRRSRRRR
jgi:hypothetical protein